ncbi:MAG: putative sodium-dependent transporter yocS [Planctomycetota bacterium]
MRLLGDRFWITALVMLLLGMTVPGDWGWLKALVPVALGGILFCSGLRIDPRAFLADARDGALARRLGLMAAAKLLAIPLAAWGVALLVAPHWATGVLLVAAMPAGFTSIAIADLHGGRRAAAVLLVALTSALVPLTVPAFLTGLAGGGQATVAAVAERAGYILLLLAAPLALAQAVRALAPAWTVRHDRAWGPAAITCSCLLVFIATAGNRDGWTHWPLVRLVEPVLVTLIPGAAALGAALLLRRRLPASEAVVFAGAAVYVNNGLAVAFATRFYPGQAEVLLPCLLMQIPMVCSTALLRRLFPVPETRP